VAPSISFRERQTEEIMKKIIVPEIDSMVDQIAELLGVESCEDKEKLRERLSEIVPIYLLSCSSERMKFKPSEEAKKLRRIADRLNTDRGSRAALLEEMPVAWRGRVGERGPSKRDLLQTQLRGVELIDRLIDSAATNDADLELLIRWMRRAAHNLGYASPGAPKQGARRYAIRELEKLLNEICGESVTSTQEDESRQVRWAPLLGSLKIFFTCLGETVDAESLQHVRRSLRAPTS
jgi:hypothetical protein